MRLRTAVLLGSLGLSVAAAVAMRWGAGTDREAALELLPVRGVVFLGGMPLELRPDDFGKIWFHPDSSQGNASADIPAGDISSDGRYILFTRGQEGAPAGWYRVALLVNRTRDSGHPNQKRKSLIPESLGDSKTSGVRLLVGPDRPPTAYDIRVVK